VEVVAEYRPDDERALQALLLLLGIEGEPPPADEHSDAISVESVS
jgi:hypothetical protein